MFGEHGLAFALHDAKVRLGLGPSTPGGMKTVLSEGAECLAHLLDEIQQAARGRLISLPDDAPPPTLVLAIDQAEELFNSDTRTISQGDEAQIFLDLIGKVLRARQSSIQADLRAQLIIIFTIRSDRYEPLQTAPQLAGLKSLVLDSLKPMPRAQFKEVIIGPAQRATAAGHGLELQPALIKRLLEDCEMSGDALPLLGLTMARLYRDYAADGDLRLDEYEHMGGMADVIKNEAESVLSTDPQARATQLDQLRDAFIPALVTINSDTDLPIRRVARMADLSVATWPLISLMVDRHLLLSDLREGETVIEVQWREWVSPDIDYICQCQGYPSRQTRPIRTSR